MSQSTSESDPADDGDWQTLIEAIEPLRSPARVVFRPRIKPRARMRREDAAAVLAEAMEGLVEPEDWDTGDEVVFRRSGVRTTTLRRLRRGQFAIQADLDLHGMSRAQAHLAMAQFLLEARARGWSCVRIVHGKGLGSPQGRGVLKRRAQISLEHHEDVLAYASAPAWAGGFGAVLVLLRAYRG